MRVAKRYTGGKFFFFRLPGVEILKVRHVRPRHRLATGGRRDAPPTFRTGRARRRASPTPSRDARGSAERRARVTEISRAPRHRVDADDGGDRGDGGGGDSGDEGDGVDGGDRGTTGANGPDGCERTRRSRAR